MPCSGAALQTRRVGRDEPGGERDGETEDHPAKRVVSGAPSPTVDSGLSQPWHEDASKAAAAHHHGERDTTAPVEGLHHDAGEGQLGGSVAYQPHKEEHAIEVGDVAAKPAEGKESGGKNRRTRENDRARTIAIDQPANQRRGPGDCQRRERETSRECGTRPAELGAERLEENAKAENKYRREAREDAKECSDQDTQG